MPAHLAVPPTASALPPTSPAPPNFDRIARPYSFLEHLTLGRSLERCREHFLPLLTHASHALVLGDGDGRFLARLLVRNPTLQADAVDLSASMLTLLKARCDTISAPDRLSTYHLDALAFVPPPATRYDLVITHFFLDCLTDPQLETLTRRLAPSLAPGALWLLSDFRIPRGLLHLPARLLVRGLYLAFRLLTGLRPTRLPNYAAALLRIGFHPLARHRSLFGLLTTEFWQAPSPHARIQTPMPHDPIFPPPPPTGPVPEPSVPEPTPHSKHHTPDHIDTLYGTDPLSFIATPPILIEDLNADPEPPGQTLDAIPNPEPPSPSLPAPDPGVFQRHPGKRLP